MDVGTMAEDRVERVVARLRGMSVGSERVVLVIGIPLPPSESVCRLVKGDALRSIFVIDRDIPVDGTGRRCQYRCSMRVLKV